MSHLAPRFWLPRDQPLRLDDAGFLPDPTDPFGQAANPQARQLEQLRDNRCLILLGEPGLGKSTALGVEREALLAQKRPVHYVDLGATGQENILRTQIFEAEAFQSWSAGEGILHLLLDSLDEARLRIKVIADLLIDGLKSVDVTRLRLQLACRSADRHRRLEGELTTLFGSQHTEIVELLPLRAADVIAFATEADLDGDALMSEVISRNLVPLASRPLTLGLLLRAAKDDGALPESVTDLYVRGCRLLAEEPDEDRRDQSTAKLSVPQRVGIAARIAGAMVLAGRSSVLVDAQAPPTRDDVGVEELIGGRETTDSAVTDTFAAEEDTVKETLATGLFSARGDGRLGFAHQTFAEFLAARYLATHMTDEQLLSLITSNEVEGRRVIPQLREVATWLATVSPSLFDRLLKTDLDVLLRGDLTSLDDDQRASLVRALFLAAPERSFSRWEPRIRNNLRSLTHPGIQTQITDVLLDPAASLPVRQAAAELAGACEVQQLADEMVTLALDDDAPPALRQSTILALGDGWADPQTLERLLDLALNPPDYDNDDELRGSTLRALWPGAITAEQLFGSLRPPQRQTLLGFYRMFLKTELLKQLPDADLPAALRWAASLPREHSPTDALSELAQDILIRAWEHRSDPAVFTELVNLIRTFLLGGYDMLDHRQATSGVALADRDGRRAVITALIPDLAANTLKPVHVVFSTPRLLLPDDAAWLIDELHRAHGSQHERGWARLIAEMAGFDASEAAIMQARESSQILRELTSARFDPVTLDSPRAEEERHNFQRWQEWQQRRTKAPEDTLDMDARITEDLDRIEAGDLDAFWHLNLDLSVEPGQTRYMPNFQSDLTKFHGWQTAEEKTRERILAAAERYLEGGDPAPDEWFGQNKITHGAVAGYRALRLLTEHAPDRLAALGQDAWVQWAPIIVSWHADAVEDADVNTQLIAQCLAVAPEQTRDWILRGLDAEIAANGHAFSIRRVRGEHLLEQPLLERIANDELPSPARVEMLAGLLEHNHPVARELAERLLDTSRLQQDTDQRAVAIDVARLLLEYTPDAGWPVVWPLVQVDSDFGRAVFESLAHGSERSVVTRLDERQLAELFSWLEHQYPHSEDPPLQESGFVGVREQVGRWRDQVVTGLAHVGSEEAILQLDRLQQTFPELEWLGRLRSEAQEFARRARWTPPTPGNIVEMAADKTRRWVTDDAELRAVLLAALARAGEQLQAATPAAADLWNTNPQRPKLENELSDWLKRYLVQDLHGCGVVLGREVQIRPGPGGKMGESGDLVVEAVAGERVEGADVVSVTIEVKGCWNTELDEAMRTQLAERYLLSECQRQGIYVVGWFAADDWDRTDWKQSPCARRGLDESRAFFTQQAREVSAAYHVEIAAVVLDCSLPPRHGPARRD
jgi:hypothetical protein